MRKYCSVFFMLLLVMLECGHDTASGGGASETVASAALWNGSITVAVESDGPFTVTVEACSDSFSLADTQHFHVTTVLTDQTPEWVVPQFFADPISIVIRNHDDSTVTLFHFTWNVNAKDTTKSKQLADGGAVGGIVTERLSDGTIVPASGIRVLVKGTFFSATADEQGFYRIDGIPEGGYTLTTSILNKANYRNGVPVTVNISGDTTVVRNLLLE